MHSVMLFVVALFTDPDSLLPFTLSSNSSGEVYCGRAAFCVHLPSLWNKRVAARRSFVAS